MQTQRSPSRAIVWVAIQCLMGLLLVLLVTGGLAVSGPLPAIQAQSPPDATPDGSQPVQLTTADIMATQQASGASTGAQVAPDPVRIPPGEAPAAPPNAQPAAPSPPPAAALPGWRLPLIVVVLGWLVRWLLGA